MSSKKKERGIVKLANEANKTWPHCVCDRDMKERGCTCIYRTCNLSLSVLCVKLSSKDTNGKLQRPSNQLCHLKFLHGTFVRVWVRCLSIFCLVKRYSSRPSFKPKFSNYNFNSIWFYGLLSLPLGNLLWESWKALQVMSSNLSLLLLLCFISQNFHRLFPFVASTKC